MQILGPSVFHRHTWVPLLAVGAAQIVGLNHRTETCAPAMTLMTQNGTASWSLHVSVKGRGGRGLVSSPLCSVKGPSPSLEPNLP